MYLVLGLMNLIQYGPVSKEAVKEIVGNAKKPVNVDLEVGGDIDEIADMEIGVIEMYMASLRWVRSPSLWSSVMRTASKSRQKPR